MLIESRRAMIEAVLRTERTVKIGDVAARFGISPMTARRDLEILQRRGAAHRTHGGAVLPATVPQDCLAVRSDDVSEAISGLADAMVDLLKKGETIFLDSSSVACHVARRIVERGVGVRVITNGGSVMRVVAASEHPQVHLFAIGGTLRRATWSYVGPEAVRSVLEHFADRVIFSVDGITTDGMLTDADLREAQVKRGMLDRADQSVLLLDRPRLTPHGGVALASLQSISLVLRHESSLAAVTRSDSAS